MTIFIFIGALSLLTDTNANVLMGTSRGGNLKNLLSLPSIGVQNKKKAVNATTRHHSSEHTNS